jgi:hypothetical protein
MNLTPVQDEEDRVNVERRKERRGEEKDEPAMRSPFSNFLPTIEVLCLPTSTTSPTATLPGVMGK